MLRTDANELVALRHAMLKIALAVHNHLPADGTSRDEFIDRIIEILADPAVSPHLTALEEGAGRPRMPERSLWNIGLKIEDLDREITFLSALGAKLVLRDTFHGPSGLSSFALLEFGGTRLFLTPQPVFEEKLASPLQPGLTHAVFETEDFEAEFRKALAAGAEVLIEPTEIVASFGARRIAFFKSPGGLIFELMQIHVLPRALGDDR